MKTRNYEIISSQSGIEWIGRKITGSHNGTIEIREGVFTLNDDQLSEGSFVIDTTSIQILDVVDPATNSQFAAHLASDDFFSSDKFPRATFETTSIIQISDNSYHIDGNLTIKGITAPASFDAFVSISNHSLMANAKVTIDRTKFNMKFRSGNFFKDLGDTLIYNDFDLFIKIAAKAA